MKRIFLEEIPSTNDYAKARRKDKENLLVVAKRQTGGRGTKGRSFSSGTGGVYLSRLEFYENFPAKDAFRIMQGAAAAVCETLSSFGVTPQIKWPNDVYVNGKKICGILIENTFCGYLISSSVVGIGLNVCNRLPVELSSIATSLCLETGKEIGVDEVVERLLEVWGRENIHERYAQYLGWLGEEITLIIGENEGKIEATLLSVDSEGGLWARVDGKEKRFVAAEVSLRVANSAEEEL